MDWISCRNSLAEWIRKYRSVLLVLLAGLVLMLLPSQEEGHQPQQQTQAPSPDSLQESLGGILSLIEGAGKVEVLLTESAGEEILYQTDDSLSTGENSSDRHRDTVMVSDSDRKETGLIRQINPPSYLGAVVLCQGADSANVRLSIVEAVMSVTGLPSNCITVLKMK